eukprot:1152524-Pelagomonas_calceolata.AAC.1
MEGANLYDVFQKISKGNYEPLPADQFSPTLRKLVTSMLHVDPAGKQGATHLIPGFSSNGWGRPMIS